MRIFHSAILLVSLIAIGTTGCGSNEPRPQRLTPTVNYLHIVHTDAESASFALPVLNSEAVAELGDSMISGGKIYRRPAIKISSQIQHGGINMKGIHYTITIPGGVLYRSGVSDIENSPGTFYAAEREVKMDVAGYITDVQGGIFIPDNKLGAMAIYWQDSEYDNTPSIDFIEPIRYESAIFETWGEDSFRRELVYNGRSGQTIKLMYREFAEEMIRPAFTQDVTYDLKVGDVIGFKGARFKVNDADNTKIRYVVLQHLQ